MSNTLLLGFIAGVTILFGLPVGRLRRPAPGLRLSLNALAVGILFFLTWDVLSAAWEPIDAALGNMHEHATGLAPVLGYGALFTAGLGAVLLGVLTLLIAFSVSPSGGDETGGVSAAVAEAVKVVRDSGLPCETNAMFTNSKVNGTR
jgi:Thiamine-binding protein